MANNLVFSDIINKEIKKGYISHAYLIDENNNNGAFDLVISFVKEILCLNVSNQKRDKICKRIDDGNYSELKIIKPDGMLIKKQQIIDLQREFSMEAVEGSRRIYVIRDCEKMRPETANSMLKFLEEPDNNITAFLMTNNIEAVLETIISRCQVIKLNNSSEFSIDNDLDKQVLEFINNIECMGKKSIILNENILSDIISSKDREKLISFIDKLIDMYLNIMKIVIDDKNINLLYYDELVKYVDNNDINRLTYKINCLIDAKDSIKYNVNINLLIDKVILRIGG